MGNTPATSDQGAATAQPLDPPWHQGHRSRLWAHEDEIRRLQAEGYSLRQIINRLSLCIARPTLWRWLQRVARRNAGASPGGPPPVPPNEDADDEAALDLLDASGFQPPSSPNRTL